MDDIQQRIEQSVSRNFKAVFPDTTNHYDTLFGGTAMRMMDEVAFIAATRFTRMRMVTVSSDKIDFNHPIAAGTIIELVARVSHIGRTSIKVRVEIFVEQMYEPERHRAIHGEFTLVAVDEDKKPVPIMEALKKQG
ncbi:MAG: acyl-CoA thioesterase [Mucilaginibacter polytrichastri]|nr:acyl-CoA thioesterase [Mucilaginibacter polytrichastri]